MSLHERIEPVEGLIRRDENGEIIGFATAYVCPERDLIATSEGIGTPGFTVASDPDIRDALINHLRDHGIPIRAFDPKNSVRIHGFSAKNWNSPWEPKGPQPNWLVIKNPAEQ
ncbi:MAG: hypothetical protein G01um10145_287 [Microgenomates group bacterium Gr01-1014_5]|nr:MAG: hypothetical protein G01um10145_287 [Microgenomates group bacterium Gr01-1014_5]